MIKQRHANNVGSKPEGRWGGSEGRIGKAECGIKKGGSTGEKGESFDFGFGIVESIDCGLPWPPLRPGSLLAGLRLVAA
jgi:hypothetical protein